MKKVVQVQVSTAKRGFYEKYTQTIDNTKFLTLRFLHILNNIEEIKFEK